MRAHALTLQRCPQLVRGGRAALAVVRVAADYKVSLWGLDKGSTQYTQALEDCHSRAAEKVLQLCRTQAGVYIKAGQLLASLRPVVPRQYTDALAQLCDDAPQSLLHDVRRVFREDLGADMEQLFHHIDPEPIGCASLAQVHKAWLKGRDGGAGQMVAVKVQHAWMSKHTQSDTLVMETAAGILELLFPGVEIRWLIPVFRRNLSSELNFLCEAANMQRCARNFAGDAGVRVPQLFERFTSRRVLTMEFIDGIKVNDPLQSDLIE
jgi:aarF domain-containing kinase